MSKLDSAIEDALTEEDAEFLAKLEEEPGSLQQIVGIFQGPLNWIYVTLLVAAIVVGIFGVYSGWQFALSTGLRPLFYWGAVTGFCLLVLAVVRIVFFMQINTNRILREIKRLELQVALLAARKSG
jgi:cytochrome b561